MLRSLIAAVLFAIAGCASTEVDRELTTYVGDNIKLVTERLGSATRITRVEDGGRLYEWQQDNSYAVSTSVMGLPLPKTKPKSCKRVMLVNQQKVVVSHTLVGKC
jgi:hypothetical protein